MGRRLKNRGPRCLAFFWQFGGPCSFGWATRPPLDGVGGSRGWTRKATGKGYGGLLRAGQKNDPVQVGRPTRKVSTKIGGDGEEDQGGRGGRKLTVSARHGKFHGLGQGRRSPTKDLGEMKVRPKGDPGDLKDGTRSRGRPGRPSLF